jgi:repressor LexA
VPRFLLGRVRPEHVYALRVKGDSMIDEHICDGDIALIEDRKEARNGEIVVALLIEENQATLNTFLSPRRQCRTPAGQLSTPAINRSCQLRCASRASSADY